MVPERPPPERRVALFEAALAPEATVVIPPRTARAPSDAPAPAALPPRLAPAPTADPIVRTTASAGPLTTAGAFSCQIRAPYPATAPSNPATSHSSISAPPIGRLHGQQFNPSLPSPLRHHPDWTKPSRSPGRRGAVARVLAQDPLSAGCQQQHRTSPRRAARRGSSPSRPGATWGQGRRGRVLFAGVTGMACKGSGGSSPLSSTRHNAPSPSALSAICQRFARKRRRWPLEHSAR
jgi:hypothetical protein